MIRGGFGGLLEKEGIEWLNVYSVDNVLQRICDPVFVGATLVSGCNCSASEDPCELFSAISFPVNEFFPPNTIDTPCDYEGTKSYCCSR